MISAKSYKQNTFLTERVKAKVLLKDLTCIDQLKTNFGISKDLKPEKLTEITSIINFLCVIGRDESDKFFNPRGMIRPPLSNIINYLIHEIGFTEVQANNLLNLCLHTGIAQKGGWFNTNLRTGSADKINYQIENYLNNSHEQNNCNILTDNIIYNFITNQYVSDEDKQKCNLLLDNINRYSDKHVLDLRKDEVRRINNEEQKKLFEELLNDWVAKAPDDERENRIKAKDLILNCKNWIKLDLRGMKLTELPPKEAVAMLTNLVELDFSNNKLTKLDSDTLDGYRNLIWFDLSRNQIENIDKLAFAGFSKLKHLFLISNKLTELKDHTFIECGNLVSLYVNNNQIERMEQNALKGLSMLKSIELSNNKIDDLKDNLFEGLTRLKYLYLSFNCISKLNKNTFCGLNRLVDLCLGANRLTTLEDEIFSPLIMLVKLNLSINQISKMTINAFSRLYNLTNIYLNHNLLEELAPKQFSNLTCLISLAINDNKLKKISKENFFNLHKLKYLELAKNQITDFGQETLGELANLEKIDFKDNPMDNIPNEAFANYQNIILEYTNQRDKLMIILDKNQFIQDYIKCETGSLKYDSLELYALALLAANNLREPEAIAKLSNRIESNSIDITKINEGIDFFIRLNSVTKISLLSILTTNIEFFIKKDGKKALKDIFQNHLIPTPTSKKGLEQQINDQINCELKRIKTDFDVENVISLVSSNSLQTTIDNQHINSMKRLTENVRFFENLDEDVYSDILNILKSKQVYTPQQRLIIIKTLLKNSFHGQNLREYQEMLVTILASSLNNIHYEEKSKEYLANYLMEFGFATDQELEEITTTIMPYLKWPNMIEKKQAEDINELKTQTEVLSLKLRTLAINSNEAQDYELYFSYQLSILPFLNASDIHELLEMIAKLQEDKQVMISDEITKQLNLVNTYCNLNGIENNDKDPLKLVLAKHSANHALIYFQEISFLNPEDAINLYLNQAKICICDDSLLTYLQNLANDTIIFSQQDQEKNNLLLEKLKQILFSGILPDSELSLILEHEGNCKPVLKDVRKADLLNILNNELFRLHICSISSKELSLFEIKSMNLPAYIEKIVSNKNSVKNILAQNMVEVVNSIAKYNNINLSEQESKILTQLIFQIVLNPSGTHSLSLDFRKKLMEKFKEDEFYRTHFQQSAIKISTEYEQQGINNLPEIIINNFDKDKVVELIDNLMQTLYDNLRINDVDKDNIKLFQVYLILGINFLSLSSMYALGYLDGNKNVAFARIRFYAAYCLAKALKSEDSNLNQKEKDFILNKLKDTILTAICSGELSHSLFGPYHDRVMDNLFIAISKILATKLV